MKTWPEDYIRQEALYTKAELGAFYDTYTEEARTAVLSKRVEFEVGGHYVPPTRDDDTVKKSRLRRLLEFVSARGGWRSL